jgi:hypothetical protein
MHHHPVSIDIQPASLKRESLCGIRLIQLHGARWRLMARMEDEQGRSGKVTADLDANLAAHRAETRTFLTSLRAHASA